MSGDQSERSRLLSGAGQLGVTLSDPAASRLLAYLDELYSAWNRSAGLTRIAREDAVRLHLLDSLALLPLFGGLLGPDRAAPEPGKAQFGIADLGTGGGLPGVPLALMLPEASVSVVDSRRRRCVFLEQVCRRLALSNCRVIHADARSLDARAGYDVIVSRAFREPVELLRLSLRLLAAGGSVIVMAARKGELEVPAGLSEQECRELVLPGGDEPRVLRRFAKL